MLLLLYPQRCVYEAAIIIRPRSAHGQTHRVLCACRVGTPGYCTVGDARRTSDADTTKAFAPRGVSYSSAVTDDSANTSHNAVRYKTSFFV